jgi:hypothetical protein
VTVFISYARRDRRRVTKLAHAIEGLRKRVWSDARLEAGDVWWDAILQNIRDCDFFVVALSRHWVRSKACNREHEYAQDTKRVVVPVQIGRMGFRQTPESLRRLQIVPYRRGNAEELVELNQALERPVVAPLPEPLPDPPAPPPADPSWRMLVGAIAAMAIVVAVVLAIAQPWDGGGNTLTVDGRQTWTDTGRDLQAGDRVTIEASGTVVHNVQDPLSATGPGGDPRSDLFQYNEIPGNHAALMARIGDGEPFIVGGGSAFTAPAPGRLWLGVNDKGPENNSGHFNATIEGGPAAAGEG